MKFTLVPDYCFSSFEIASAQFLSSIGVKGVILDVDNTLEPYENPYPTDKVIEWLKSLNAKGIKAAIVSNNEKERIDKFNEKLLLPAYSKAKKPFKKYIILAMQEMKISSSEAIFIGDQILTDVWAARNAKIRAILVPPIKDKTDFFTRFKRKLEKPILKRYKKKNKCEEIFSK